MSGPARKAVLRSLDAIAEQDGTLNCFTSLRREEALAEADRADRARAPLAGMTFATKNLFDIAGEVTVAGSFILGDQPPAARDAFVVERLRAAGASLLGALNMDEFAYGFSTENHHYGPTRNPHDYGRIAGGSSGGSAAAVAAGMVDVALGSDTNGSIRIPASLCGVYGLKPTFGGLSRRGAFPFAASLDHVGHFAATLTDLARAFDAMQGYDGEDPTMQDRPPVATLAALEDDGRPLRVARLGGWFASLMTTEVAEAMDQVAVAAGADRTVELPGAEAARSAAFVITAAEGGQLHRQRLRTRPQDFDPATRDRLFAGALLPAAAVLQAQRVRTWFRDQTARLFAEHDVLLAPATFTTAPEIGQATVTVGGRTIPVRANLGLYTQPLSFVGLPVLAAPIAIRGLPVGVQIIAPPWREELAFRLAARLECLGAVAASCRHRKT
jgi:AtzE family amidohydrolase